MSRYTVPADQTPISWFNYTYDSRGRRTAMATHYGAWAYEYDDLGHLTRAVLASARRNAFSLYMYEATLPGGISPDPFHAQKYVDISDTIDAKMASLACYDTQLEAYGQSWLDAIRGRAAYRGFRWAAPTPKRSAW